MSFVDFDGIKSPSKVEVAGVEPASKQGTPELSTRLAYHFVLLLAPRQEAAKHESQPLNLTR